MALKIAIVPVMLLSILWRNRREKRRRAESMKAGREERTAARRDVVALGSADIGVITAALDRVEMGDCLVSERGLPLTAQRLRQTLASALMDAGRFSEAAPLLDGVEDEEDSQMMLCRARLHAHTGDEKTARALLSRAADVELAATRAAARGLRVHLAVLLAEGLSGETPPLSLLGSRLSALGPLELLALSGREQEAKALAAELVAVLDAKLFGLGNDPDIRIDGLPGTVVHRTRAALLAFILT